MAGNLPVVNCDKNNNYRGHTEHSADQYHENFDSWAVFHGITVDHWDKFKQWLDNTLEELSTFTLDVWYFKINIKADIL